MINSKQFILNLGAGCVDTSRYARGWFTVHVDGCYRPDGAAISAGEVEKDHVHAINRACSDNPVNTDYPKQVLCYSDIFDFVERYPYKFDYIYAERIFEHMEYVGGDIGRLLEGINRISEDDAELEIVVPNGRKLARMLLDYDSPVSTRIESDNHKLIINTEFCNVKADPHGSVWTHQLAKEYINSEGTWRLDTVSDLDNFMGRDIYMKLICKKTNGVKV